MSAQRGTFGDAVERTMLRGAMPTAAQAVVLLNLLAGHRFRWSLDAFSECRRAMWTAAGPTRQGRINVRLTPAGRDALARYLLRAWRP